MIRQILYSMRHPARWGPCVNLRFGATRLHRSTGLLETLDELEHLVHTKYQYVFFVLEAVVFLYKRMKYLTNPSASSLQVVYTLIFDLLCFPSSVSSCSRIRAQAFSIFTAINWLSNLFIGLFTLSAIEAMGAWLLPDRSGSVDDEGIFGSPSPRDQQKAGVAGLYAVFSLLSVLAVAFIYFFVRETMGKSLEELEEGGGRAGVRDGGGDERVAFGLAGVPGSDEDVRFGLLEGSELGGGSGSGDEGEDACRVVL